jgi:putative tributyrin esterase
MARFVCNVISYTLRRTVDITVIIPTPTFPDAAGLTGVTPKHTPSVPYPVLYLLHGGGNNHATWTGYANVEFYAEERNIAVVMPSGENKFYVDWPSDPFFAFIAEELPDFVTGLFPVSKRPQDTYIAGLSMGGYGTVVHALNFPERFCAFGPLSATFQLPNPTALAGTLDPDPRFDPLALAEKLAAQGKQFPKSYLACGKKDFLYEANVRFRDRLRELGCEVTWDETEEHGHEWRFWNLEIERFLDWLPRTDPYALVGRKRQI